MFREDDTEQNEFVEADIDAILQRRAHKVLNFLTQGTSFLNPTVIVPPRSSMRRMELSEDLLSGVLAKHHS